MFHPVQTPPVRVEERSGVSEMVVDGFNEEAPFNAICTISRIVTLHCKECRVGLEPFVPIDNPAR